jgi:hypothetical protein
MLQFSIIGLAGCSRICWPMRRRKRLFVKKFSFRRECPPAKNDVHKDQFFEDLYLNRAADPQGFYLTNRLP